MKEFANITPSTYGESKFKRTLYMRLMPGNHVIRILDTATEFFIHYVNRAYVQCLGDECPICENNRKIRYENPKDYSNISGYSSRSPRYVFNVLDKTQVKVCPQCESENNMGANSVYDAVCWKCQTFVTDTESISSGKVKLLSCGITIVTDLSALHQSVTNEGGDILGVHNYDVALNTRVINGRKSTTPIPSLQNAGPIEVDKDLLFEHGKAIAQLNLSEVKSLLTGVTLRDIYLARRTDKTEAVEKPVFIGADVDSVSELAKDSIDSTIKDLYGEGNKEGFPNN